MFSRSSADRRSICSLSRHADRVAAKLCEADIAAIIRQKGDAYYWATSYGLPPESSEYIKMNVAIEPGTRDRCRSRAAGGQNRPCPRCS